MNRVSLACLTTLAAPLIVTTGVNAADADRSAAERGETNIGLEEVIVTARKRDENLQQVPASVVAFSAEQIERYNLSSLENIAGSSPELFIGRASAGSGAQITMRGIGSQATSIGIEQSTAVVVDGVYYGQGLFLNEALFDLQSIQILKGPQALFFGKNATAGVIAISTASPTDKFEALARVGYEFGSEDLSGEGVISGPITSNLRGRVAVHASKMSGGYFRNDAVPTSIGMFDLATGNVIQRVQQPNNGGIPGTQDIAGRATLVWEPVEQLTATLKLSGSHKKDDANAWNYVPFACPSGFTQPNPAVRCAKEFVVHIPNAPDGVGGNVPDSKADGSSYNEYKSYAITGDIVYRFDAAKLSSSTNYNWYRNTWGLAQNVQSPTSFIAATQNTSFGAFSNETRYQTEFQRPVNFMIGGYYQKTERKHTQAGAFAPLEDSSLPLDRRFVSYIKPAGTDGETLSGFGQVTWRVIPELELATGARYIRETKDSFLQQSYIMPALQGAFPQGAPIVSDQTFSNWNPEFSASYYANDNVMLYAGYKSAYKSGGFSDSAFITATTIPSYISFSPETARGFEAGLKSTLLDNQLRFNLSAYVYDYKDLQIDYFDSVTFQFITTNAGKVRIQGVQLEPQFAPNALPGLRLYGNVNYNKARYREYIAPCYTGQSISAGCSTTFQGGPGQDLSGTPTAVAPDWIASLGAVFERNVSADTVLELAADGRYSSSYLGSSFGAPLSRQSAFAKLNASVRLHAADNQWEVALIGRNITDVFSISGALSLPNSGSGTGTNSAVPADQVGLVDLPRTVMLQYTQRF